MEGTRLIQSIPGSGCKNVRHALVGLVEELLSLVSWFKVDEKGSM